MLCERAAVIGERSAGVWRLACDVLCPGVYGIQGGVFCFGRFQAVSRSQKCADALFTCSKVSRCVPLLQEMSVISRIMTCLMYILYT